MKKWVGKGKREKVLSCFFYAFLSVKIYCYGVVRHQWAAHVKLLYSLAQVIVRKYRDFWEGKKEKRQMEKKNPKQAKHTEPEWKRVSLCSF